MKNNNLGQVFVAHATRVDSLDLYKGLAILLVVAGHLVQTYAVDFDRSMLFKGIYMFHMPLFFLVSGMVYAVKLSTTMSISGFGMSVLKRARQLLLPFIAWCLVGYFISHNEAQFDEYMINLMKRPDAGLWFLWVLFVFTCVADFGRLVASASRLPLWLLLVAVWALFFHLRIDHTMLGVGLIAFHMPFFFAGIFHRQIVEGVRGYVGLLSTICALAFPVLVSQWVRVNPPEIGLMLQQAYSLPMTRTFNTVYLGIGYLYQAAFAVVGIVVFFSITKAFTEAGGAKPFVTRWLCFLGQRTLEIYALHFYMIQYAYFNASPFMNGLVAMVMATGLSILIADYLLKPSKVVALLLFGKSPRNVPT